MKQLTEEEQAKIGREWAEILQLKPHKDERGNFVEDAWDLQVFGWKTSLGVFRSICRMVDEARGEENNAC